MRRMPCSGRCGRGSASYLGPPTAPHSTASASFASLSVRSGSGSPCASKPAPPKGASSSSSLRPSARSAFRTLVACATISGPMPSPARPAIFIARTRCLCEQPRLRLAVLLFESLDLVRVRERETDVVEPVHDAVLAMRIDVEVVALAIRRRHHLLLEIDGEPIAFV